MRKALLPVTTAILMALPACIGGARNPDWTEAPLGRIFRPVFPSSG